MTSLTSITISRRDRRTVTSQWLSSQSKGRIWAAEGPVGARSESLSPVTGSAPSRPPSRPPWRRVAGGEAPAASSSRAAPCSPPWAAGGWCWRTPASASSCPGPSPPAPAWSCSPRGPPRSCSLRTCSSWRSSLPDRVWSCGPSWYGCSVWWWCYWGGYTVDIWKASRCCG